MEVDAPGIERSRYNLTVGPSEENTSGRSNRRRDGRPGKSEESAS